MAGGGERSHQLLKSAAWHRHWVAHQPWRRQPAIYGAGESGENVIAASAIGGESSCRLNGGAVSAQRNLAAKAFSSGRYLAWRHQAAKTGAIA
jgi:hypothetical protein